MKFYLLDSKQADEINAVVIALPRSERHVWHKHFCASCKRYWQHPGAATKCEHIELYDCPDCESMVQS